MIAQFRRVKVLQLLVLLFIAASISGCGNGLEKQNLKTAKSIALASIEFARQHDGRLPNNLIQLSESVPISKLKFRDADGLLHDWIYLGSGQQTSGAPMPLLVSPQPLNNKMIVVMSDGSGCLLRTSVRENASPEP